MAERPKRERERERVFTKIRAPTPRCRVRARLRSAAEEHSLGRTAIETRILTCFQVGVPVADGVHPPRLLDLAPALERLLPVRLLLSLQPVDRHLEKGARLTSLLSTKQERACSGYTARGYRGGAGP